MITAQQFSTLIGAPAIGDDGTLGTVGEVHLDDATGRPEWATVRTGLFGTEEAFVPLARADVLGGELRVPYDEDTVTNAPHVYSDGHLSPAGETELHHDYGMGTGTTAQEQTPTTGTAGHGTA